MKFTKDFDLVRLTHSDTATRNHIEEQFNPPPSVVANLNLLANKILQPLKDGMGDFFVTCAYRCPAVNKTVGGAASSQHLVGEAADLVLTNGANITIAKKILELNLPFDQMIIEGGTLAKPNWIHVSYSGRNRRQILRADFTTGTAVYTVLTKEQIIAI
jgi:zinc D-Ala-D-Ala carboxypeptidase